MRTVSQTRRYIFIKIMLIEGGVRTNQGYFVIAIFQKEK